MPAQTSLEPFDRVTSSEYGLPGQKLDEIINQFIAAAKTDPFTTWLFLPTKRLVLHVNGILISKNIPFIPSRICTLDGFCSIMLEENRTTERFITKSESKLLLNQVLEDPNVTAGLFSSHDRTSSGTIDDLMTFMNVVLTRKVLFPECLLDLESEKSRQLETIIKGYRDQLKSFNLVDGDTILEWTIDFLDRSGSQTLGSVFIYGFHEPLPLEQDLVDAIIDHSVRVSRIFPDGIDSNVFRSRAAGDPPVFDPATVPAQVTGLFSESVPLPAGDFFHVRTFPTRYTEVYGIAAEISRLNSEGVPLSDIAIVFPDLRRDLALIEEVFADFTIPWNAAVGPRLSRSPVIQFLLGITSLAGGIHSRENIVQFVGSPFFRRGPVPGGDAYLNGAEVDLVSRYAGIDGSHPDWKKRLDWLHHEMQNPERAKSYRGISPHSVERVMEGTGLLLRDLKSLSGTRTLTEHAERFRAFLKKWNIPNLYTAPEECLKEQEITAYSRFCSRLDAMARAAWIPENEPVDFKVFSGILSAIADEPDDTRRQDNNGVAALGLRECPHMKFPIVFLGGLTEGVFPRLTTRLPFTNSLENARMGTRTLSEILREEQYYFIAAILSAGTHCYLSAPLADGEKTLLTSAFFERIRMRAGECPWPDDESPAGSCRTAAVMAGSCIRDGDAGGCTGLISDSRTVDDLVLRINMERYYRKGACDSAFDGILAGDESISTAIAGQYGPDHIWSPTSLETYATCPFAYFLRRVIGLEPLPEVELNLSASDRGTVIHDILSSFYRQWQAAGHGKVSLSSIADATDLILKISEEELGKYSFTSPLWDATRILMLGDQNTGPGYFERFLASEAEEAGSPLVPARFEFSFGMQPTPSDDPASFPEPVELAPADGGGKLRIRGRIDRIDITPAGEFLIWDYKSGAQHPKAKDIEAGSALQLPLYLLAFEKITGSHGIGGGYYTIRREVKRSIVLADSSAKDLMVSRIRPSADFAGLVRHALDCSFAYIDGIRAGRFPLPPEEKCPNEYCDFKRVCRFDPYRVLEAEEDT